MNSPAAHEPSGDPKRATRQAGRQMRSRLLDAASRAQADAPAEQARPRLVHARKRP
jgi:hypothetical protein